MLRATRRQIDAPQTRMNITHLRKDRAAWHLSFGNEQLGKRGFFVSFDLKKLVEASQRKDLGYFFT